MQYPIIRIDPFTSVCRYPTNQDEEQAADDVQMDKRTEGDSNFSLTLELKVYLSQPIVNINTDVIAY